MVTHPFEYSWSSYPVFAGKRQKPDWLTTGTLLSYFEEENKEAIAMYLARDLSGISRKGLGAFFDGISGAAITMKYNQMNAELTRDKKLSDKMATFKKQLLNV